MYIFVCKEERSSVSVSFIFPPKECLPKLEPNSEKEKNNTKLAQSIEYICPLISAYFMNIYTPTQIYTYLHTHQRKSNKE